MGKYGNIDGVVTLTGDVIARDNARGSIGRILAERKKSVNKSRTPPKADTGKK